MKKLIIGTISVFIILFIATMAYAQIYNKQTGCIPFMKSDGRLHCAVIDMKWDDTNNRIVVQSLDVDTAAEFFYAGTAVTSTAAELNILDTVTATAAELNQHSDVSAMSELHTASDTLVAADCGLTIVYSYRRISDDIAGNNSWL